MWWIIAAGAVMWALCQPNAARDVTCTLLIWWALGAQAAFVTLGILFCIPLCWNLDQDKRRYRERSYVHYIPSNRDWEYSPPSYPYRPHAKVP